MWRAVEGDGQSTSTPYVLSLRAAASSSVPYRVSRPADRTGRDGPSCKASFRLPAFCGFCSFTMQRCCLAPPQVCHEGGQLGRKWLVASIGLGLCRGLAFLSALCHRARGRRRMRRTRRCLLGWASCCQSPSDMLPLVVWHSIACVGLLDRDRCASERFPAIRVRSLSRPVRPRWAWHASLVAREIRYGEDGEQERCKERGVCEARPALRVEAEVRGCCRYRAAWGHEWANL